MNMLLKIMNFQGTLPKLDAIIEEHEHNEPMKRETTNEQTVNDYKKIEFV